MMRRNRRVRATGKGAGERFAALPVSVLTSPAVAMLSVATRWVLVALAAQFSGSNNGALSLPAAAAAKFGIKSRDTLYSGLARLCERGLAIQTDPGSYQPPRPARYAVTWRPLDDTPYTTGTRTASHDYRAWTPPKNKSRVPPTGTGARRHESYSSPPGTAHRYHFGPLSVPPSGPL